MKHGKQLIWVAHAINDKNYAEFEVDGEYYYRRQVIDGKRKELIKRKHGLDMHPAVTATVRLTVSPSGIVQTIQKPEGTVFQDTWLDQKLETGRFGFLIRGRDEVSLSGFSFTPAE